MIESQWRNRFSGRAAIRSLAGLLGSPLLRAQLDPFRDHSRLAALGELLTAFDFEPAAFAHVSRDVYDFMMGSSDDESTFRRNRRVFDWVTLVPRGMAHSIPRAKSAFAQGSGASENHPRATWLCAADRIWPPSIAAW